MQTSKKIEIYNMNKELAKTAYKNDLANFTEGNKFSDDDIMKAVKSNVETLRNYIEWYESLEL